MLLAMSDQPKALRSKAERGTPTGLHLSDSVELNVDIACDDWENAPVLIELVRGCVAAVLAKFVAADMPLELSVRLTDDAEIEQLNCEFRGQNKPTNVLSFPCFERDELQDAYASAISGGPPVMLGDIIITQGVTAQEAREQGKKFTDHLSHLVVHGLLHLLGFDHIEGSEASEMETQEKNILAELAIDDPYKGNN